MFLGDVKSHYRKLGRLEVLTMVHFNLRAAVLSSIIQLALTILPNRPLPQA
jgi:hypothetical protein